MNSLIRFSLKNVVAICIVTCLIILGGVYSFTSLKMEMLPNMESPVLTVSAVYHGASPDMVNEEVTTKLEEQFESIQEMKGMESASYVGMAILTLNFPNKTDLDKMEEAVNKSIENAALTERVNTEVNRSSTSMIPIYDISVFSKENPDFNAYMENEVVPALNKIQGVEKVAVSGLEEQLVQITINKEFFWRDYPFLLAL